MKQFIYLFGVVLFCSCNGEKKEKSQVMLTTPGGIQGLQTVKAPVQQQPTGSNLIFNPPHGQPGHDCSVAEGAPLKQRVAVNPQPNTNTSSTPPVSAESTAISKKLNPKHGEPNHRCDIAVGAPLDSKPVQITQTPASKPIVTQVATTKVAKGMNPPHGQPNHRCDIAVGAPLNSKTAEIKPAVVQAPVQTNTTAETLEAKNGVKLNPKHGEPGHRCDIAVGAPLT